MNVKKIGMLALILALVLAASLFAACGGGTPAGPGGTPIPDAREGFVQVVNCSQGVITSLQLQAEEDETYGRNVLTEDLESGDYISLKLFGGKAEGTEAMFSIRVTFVTPAEEEGGDPVETTVEFTELSLTQATHLKLTPETAEVVK